MELQPSTKFWSQLSGDQKVSRQVKSLIMAENPWKLWAGKTWPSDLEFQPSTKLWPWLTSERNINQVKGQIRLGIFLLKIECDSEWDEAKNFILLCTNGFVVSHLKKTFFNKLDSLSPIKVLSCGCWRVQSCSQESPGWSYNLWNISGKLWVVSCLIQITFCFKKALWKHGSILKETQESSSRLVSETLTRCCCNTKRKNKRSSWPQEHETYTCSNSYSYQDQQLYWHRGSTEISLMSSEATRDDTAS